MNMVLCYYIRTVVIYYMYTTGSATSVATVASHTHATATLFDVEERHSACICFALVELLRGYACDNGGSLCYA